MNQTNCHNCGAPITGPECEYCGTKFNIRVVEPIKDTDADARRKEIEKRLRDSKYGLATSVYERLANEVAYGAITPNKAREVVGLDPRWGVRRD